MLLLRLFILNVCVTTVTNGFGSLASKSFFNRFKLLSRSYFPISPLFYFYQCMFYEDLVRQYDSWPYFL